jgi:hypothetical protein
VVVSSSDSMMSVEREKSLVVALYSIPSCMFDLLEHQVEFLHMTFESLRQGFVHGKPKIRHH